ncbi:L-2-hydroxyglutarate oxidase [Mucilaginibacter ginkgonis]|uniref:L-2-hydroxyglutarate oxidase n=1 Tax=Mucilaginibacter ginkgonis TaxID=2682091 RepID=A0A6I4I2A3_9SPHI|nr:L-2-hydroxyglutarate oxidase [Mucilaginibacter ginkgonis]QQL50846.1 L-2-hydroxyglutarate oxidase [Mucilaginibacter ginkgonis]
MQSEKYDIIVIGAGLVGLSTAYHLKLNNPQLKVLILEKEGKVAQHQSGNNSGVIHSGIYYKPGSLKSQTCISGYTSLLHFAEKNEIPYEICGKIIVATSANEIESLNNIYDRGVKNGLVGIRKINADQSRELEPHCAAIAGIHVPQTGIIDYPKLAVTLQDLFQNQYGGVIKLNSKVNKITDYNDHIVIETNDGTYTADRIITCAGLFSDRIANLTEKYNDLRIIPFRGEYYKLKADKQYLIKNLIYPVPNPEFPFLGVHFTRMIGGGVEAGPNAVLAFKREGYKFSDVNLKDIAETVTWPGFWKIIAKYGSIGIGEIYRSLSKDAFVKALQKLVPEIKTDDLEEGGAGVRAQACNRSGFLIDDFNILQSKRITHVRNAPSPAATSSLAIGKLISEKITD